MKHRDLQNSAVLDEGMEVAAEQADRGMPATALVAMPVTVEAPVVPALPDAAVVINKNEKDVLNQFPANTRQA